MGLGLGSAAEAPPAAPSIDGGAWPSSLALPPLGGAGAGAARDGEEAEEGGPPGLLAVGRSASPREFLVRGFVLLYCMCVCWMAIVLIRDVCVYV